jgi:hypothetical protein
VSKIMSMRRIAVLVIAGALALGLVGCTPPVTRVAPTQAPTPTSAPELVVAAPDGVMASGAFRSANGSTSGQFQITNNGGTYSLTFSHWASTSSDLGVTLTDSTPAIGDCVDGRYEQVDFSQILNATSVPRTWRLADAEQSNRDHAWSDPSFLSYLVIAASTNDGCSETIVATSKLAWRVPESHPDIDVVDHGVGYSAWGKVTVKDGQPFTYLTHQGDDWAHIAKRFGVSNADLTWLNPVRIGGDDYQVAYENQVLNLDPANRGNSESRRHAE